MRYLALFASVFMTFGYWAQTLPVSVFDCSINNPEVTQAEIDADDDFYKQCVLFSNANNYLFDQDDNKDVMARTQIHIQENFRAGDFTSSGKMHLKLEEAENLDVFSMNQADLSAIPQFDKFELGIDLPNIIDQKIQNFFNGAPDPLSPFNPEDIDIRADFYLFDGATGQWSPNSVKIFGFYYEEFTDTGTDWQNENTPYDFRIRYTPRIEGRWKAQIRVYIDEVETYVANDFIFDVVDVGLKDFTRVGDNKRYFRIGEEPFFPVGQNLPWPGDHGHNPIPEDDIGEFHRYHDDMEGLANAGANYFRCLLNPISTGIEFEKLGHYEDRMNLAWETDRILNQARVLGLRIHFNLHVHYPFERATPTSNVFWDWSASSPDAYPNCTNVTNDVGNCYSTELGLVTPQEFLESQTAMKYYKMRLRYIISRWGYSPEISVLELFSEANNIGNQASLTWNGSGCALSGSNLSDPYIDDVDQPERVYEWQNEMCRYIKQDLHHTQHPLGVNYTGHPIYGSDPALLGAGCNILRKDSSYYSDYTDFWTWNSYSGVPEQFERHVEHNNNLNANGNQEYPHTPPNINKPLIYSEIGMGMSHCDYNVTWKKIIALTPFDGSSGGLSWHHNNITSAPVPYRNQLWEVYGNVQQFIEGVELDKDNWYFDYQDRTDNEAEVLYLRRRYTKYQAAMGAVHNKTVNFYTSRECDECDCSDKSELNKAVYETAKTVTPGILGNSLKVRYLEPNKAFIIQWYNPFTGQYVSTTSANTNFSGDLPLEFPPLAGNGDGSVLLFKAYRVGQPSFQPKDKLEEARTDYFFRDFHSPDHRPDVGFEEDYKPDSMNREIVVIPNPTNGNCRILFQGTADLLEIVNSMGEPVFTSNSPTSGEQLNLSSFSRGVYFVTIVGGEIHLQTKLVIQ